MNKARQLGKVIVFLIGILFLYQYAEAQHYTHELYHDFYKGLKRNDGVSSCCSNKDCRRADDWRVTPSGKYHLKIDDTWIMPPQNIIQQLPTPDGEAHACFDLGKAHIEGDKVLHPTHPQYWNWFCVIIPITML